MKSLRKSKYYLFLSVLPIVIIVGTFKVGIHVLDWEVIPKELSSFFPSILTGIVFLLGFLLAGVVSDYKESEKIPNEIAGSLFALWQEAEYLKVAAGIKSAESMMQKLRQFIPTLKSDFFIAENDNLSKLLNSISEDIIEMGKEGAAPNYILRMKAEVASIKKTVNRISVIKNTDFVPAVFICIKVIAIVFLGVYCLLKVEPWWGDLILVGIFTFVIFSILFLIKDMDDPFEYDGSGELKSGEISLAVLDNLHKEFNEKVI